MLPKVTQTHIVDHFKRLAGKELYRVHEDFLFSYCFLFWVSTVLLFYSSPSIRLRCFICGWQSIWYPSSTFLATSFRVLKTFFSKRNFCVPILSCKTKYVIILLLNQIPSFSESRPFLAMFTDEMYHTTVLKSGLWDCMSSELVLMKWIKS